MDRESRDCRPPLKVAVVGHSHVWRLEKFLNGDNVGMSRNEVRLEFIGKGGLTIAGLCHKRIVSKLRRFSPDAIVYFIGDDDINNHRSAEFIKECLIDAVKEISTCIPSVTRVTISQLLPPPRLVFN